MPVRDTATYTYTRLPRYKAANSKSKENVPTSTNQTIIDQK